MALREKIMVWLVGMALGVGSISAHAGRFATEGDGDAVRSWNQIATNAIVVTGANSPGLRAACCSRSYSSASMTLSSRFAADIGLSDGVWAPKHASVDAAIAQSAHDVLVALLPTQAAASTPARGA